MFGSSYQESTENKIKLQELTATSLHSLVGFIYTGEITISEENVEDILPAE